MDGKIRSLEHEPSNFYAFDRINYERWEAGASFGSFDKAEDTTRTLVMIHPTREQVEEGLYFVVVNHAKVPNTIEYDIEIS